MTLTAGYLRSQGVVPWNDRQGTVVAIDGQFVTEKWTDASTIDDDCVGSDAGPNTTTADLTIDGALASGGVATFTYERSVIVTVTHASSIVAVSGTVYGYDKYGNAIQEAWSVTATGTSKTYTTGKAFKKVTRVTITAASDASANTVAVGDSKKFGLAYVAADQAITGELEDTSVPTAGALTAGSTATLKDYRGLYAPNSAPDAAKDFQITYRVNPTIEQFKGSTA
jgi:hypothetical protein